MKGFFDYVDRLPLLDFIALVLLVAIVLGMIAGAISIRRGRKLIDGHWVKVESGGRTLGVVRPTGYLVPDEPRTLDGKRLPTPRYRGDR